MMVDLEELDDEQLIAGVKYYITKKFGVGQDQFHNLNPISIFNMIHKEGLKVRYDSARYLEHQLTKSSGHFKCATPIGLKTITIIKGQVSYTINSQEDENNSSVFKGGNPASVLSFLENANPVESKRETLMSVLQEVKEGANGSALVGKRTVSPL